MQVAHVCGSELDNQLPRGTGGIEVVEARADGGRGGLPSAQPIGQYGHTGKAPVEGKELKYYFTT